jgi:signal transduction histidine kinase
MKDGVLLGGIYLRLSLADVTKSILTSQRLIIVLVLLDGVIIVFFGSFLLSRVIVKPLKALVGATQGIAHGNYDQRITISEENEIGTLADSFNEMTHRLRESQQNVEEYVRSLEITNEQLQQAQIELIRSERLASIGRFAAGVAHEVGNPLGAILGYTSILQTGNDDNPELQDYLKRIEVEIHRINKIIRELLDFSRPSVVEITEVDLNGVIQSCLSLLSYQKSFSNIETVLEFNEGLPEVQADESQVQQVMVNLIINAVDSMPEGGTLKVKTGDRIYHKPSRSKNRGGGRRMGDPADADFTHLRNATKDLTGSHPFRKGTDVVCVTITDTGCGIEPENLERVFDPFFTTKDPDKGTGLGLSISMRIVESFGGKIQVESRVGKGSTFQIEFPVSRS